MLQADANPNLQKSVAVGLFVALLSTCAIFTWSLSTRLDQTTLACVFAFLLVQIALASPRSAIVITFIFLAILGDVRRLMSYYIAGSVQYDVLLLIGPIVAFVLAAVGLYRNRIDSQSKIGWWILLLMALMVLEVFNPIQGGLVVGLAGGLFYLVPLTWFWVGQAHGSPEFLRKLLFYVVVPVAVAAGLMGIWQAWAGFLDYQDFWLKTQSNIAVFVNGRARPFSFFVSPPEYAMYCSIGSSIVLSSIVLRKFRLSMLLSPFLLFCNFIQGGRGTLLANILAIVAIWGVYPRKGETRISVPRLLIAGVVLIGGLLGTMLWLQDLSADSAIKPMVSYQTEGILNPGESSATGHAMLFYTGILSSIGEPWGTGLGSTTMAAGKMGADFVAGTEIDISNMFVSLGIAGGILFIVVIAKTITSVISYLRYSNSPESLAVLAMLVCTFGFWLNGGHYAVASLLWFCIGVIDRAELDRKHQAEPA